MFPHQLIKELTIYGQCWIARQHVQLLWKNYSNLIVISDIKKYSISSAADTNIYKSFIDATIFDSTSIFISNDVLGAIHGKKRMTEHCLFRHIVILSTNPRRFYPSMAAPRWDNEWHFCTNKLWRKLT